MFAAWYPEGTHGGELYLTGPDLVKLGAFKLPGRARVNGASVAYKYDAKDPTGKSAARPSFHGVDRTKTFTIDLFVWTLEQKEAAGKVALELAPRMALPSPPQFTTKTVTEFVGSTSADGQTVSTPVTVKKRVAVKEKQQQWPPVVRIVSDQIAHLDINNVVVVDWTGWDETGRGWRCRIACLPWAQDEKLKGRPSATGTPTRPIKDKRLEDLQSRKNPPPSSQPGAAGPTG